MSTAPAAADTIERYLLRLHAALVTAPAEAREEFLREIRGHIFERLEQSTDVDAVLSAVGDPEELAREFRAQTSLAQSSRSWSAWVLMRTAARWALSGTQGFAIFMVALVGYALAATFYLTALLKPIFPHNIGIFAYDTTFNIGFDNSPAAVGHDISGPYFTLYAMLAGFLLVAGTTALLRKLMIKFARVRTRFAVTAAEFTPPAIPSASQVSETVKSLPWWKLARLAARGALSGLQGFLMFVVALVGYVTGGLFCLTAVFKPVFPDNIGVFVTDHGIQLSSWPRPQGVEIAGQYYTAIFMLLGIFLIYATSFGLRRLLQHFAHLKHRLA